MGRVVPWFVRKDIDGFFGLMIDNLIQLMLIVTLCRVACGFPDELIFARILPGAGISILVGNLFYAWQARRLAMSTMRDDVTALPYGINTPSLFAYIFLVMGPVYQETGDVDVTWKVGLAACFLSGVIETLGAFVGEWIRRWTPRAALLSTLGGIAITFIAMDFVFRIYACPEIALVPMAIIIFCYMSKVSLPFGLPAGLAALAVGTMTAWALHWSGGRPFPAPPPSGAGLSFYPPLWSGGGMFDSVTGGYVWRYLSVIVPMGIFNVVGSLQNLESAEAAGDRFETKPSMLANGIGSIAASLFGSCFPTTIYIGHPGWKALGARSGYSILNGIFMTAVCLTGAVTVIMQVVPIEAGVGILLWIGIIILAQAFQDVPRHHALAVAVGLIPSVAAWGLTMIETGLRSAGATIVHAAGHFGDFAIQGALSLSQGFIFTSMLLAAMAAHVIERKFLKASAWALASAVLSCLGLIHAYRLTPAGITADIGCHLTSGFTLGYLAIAVFLTLLHYSRKIE